jgi:hypothetical protein
LTARRFHHCQNAKCRRRLGDVPLEAPAPSVYCEACETIGKVCRDQGYADGVSNGSAAGFRSGLRLGYSRAAVVAGVSALLIAVVWAFVQF